MVVLAATISFLPASPADAAYDWDDVTDRLDLAITNEEIDGASLVIVRNGVKLYEEQFGDWASNEFDTIFSNAKWPAATIIMTLVEDSLIDLDDEVIDYIPTFDDWDAAKADITIRQLISHTSGLTSGFESCVTEPFIDMQDCIDEIAQTTLEGTPGEVFYYGELGFQVAGRIAEIVTGDSWIEVVQDRLTDPCLMPWYLYGDETFTNPWVGAGVRSRSVDYERFLRMQPTGYCLFSQILTQSSLTEMRTDQTSGSTILYSPFADGRPYGLGLWLMERDGATATVVGSPGAGGAHPWYDMDRGYVAYLFMKNDMASGGPLYDDLKPLIDLQIDAN